MNFDKYAPIKEQKPPLKSWQDSVPVFQLAEYLALHADWGITLCRTGDGELCLMFDSGIRPDRDPERWAIVEKTEGLLMSAAVDLKELISASLISLPLASRCKGE